MSEVKRPANTGSEMSDWAARANAYMDHLQSLIDAQVEKLKGRRLALDELEADLAEAVGLLRDAVPPTHFNHEQSNVWYGKRLTLIAALEDTRE